MSGVPGLNENTSAGPNVSNSGERRPRMSMNGTLVIEEDVGDVIIREGGAELKRVEYLPELRVQRLREMNIKPVEHLTFEDIRNYNRDELRAYCFVYGVPRKKKVEMEVDMARYASMYHPNDPNYDWTKYVPLEKKTDSGTDQASSPSHAPSSPSQTAGQPRLEPSMDARTPASSPGRRPGASGAASKSVHTSASPPPVPGKDAGGARVGSKRPGAELSDFVSGQNELLEQQRRRVEEDERLKWDREKAQIRTTAAKFKAAFEGQSNLTATMIENAAAYFEGRETPEAIEDKAISWERYHRNVGMLKEIFDEAEPLKTEATPDVDVKRLAELLDLKKEKFTVVDVENAAAEQLDKLMTRYNKINQLEERRDRLYMKAFHRLEKATTLEELEQIKSDFEKAHDIRIVELQPRVVAREVPDSGQGQSASDQFGSLRLMSF